MSLHLTPPKDSGAGYTASSNSNKQDHIHRVNGYGDNGYTYYPAVIIGAGESGICMAYKLKKFLGIDQFRIYDRQSGLGGTWWINRYPGVACDVPAVFYSFSFAPNPKWTTFYPPGPEIYDYLQDVCDRFGLTDKIELNTEVLGAEWIEPEEIWEIRLQHLVKGTGDLSTRDRDKRIQELGKFSVYTSEETIRCKVLISSVGALVEPKILPDIPGAETFKGSVFHSARWDYSVDLTDKNVLVLGTGCSAAQFVPHLTNKPFNARSVTQLMRSPPWVVPKIIPPGGDKFWSAYAPYLMTYIPGLLRMLRYTIFALAESEFVLFRGDEAAEKKRKDLEASLNRRMRSLTPEKYHEILTPNYCVCCKRRIYDATWYKSLHDPKIELTTLPLTSVQELSVTLGPGRYYPDEKDTTSNAPTEQRTIPTDIIVLANGFEIHHWLHPLDIKGKDGKDLIKTMESRGGPQAYQGTAMDGFPNFFMIFGPNTVTGHSSVILATENMTDYAMKFIGPILKGDVKTVDVKKDAEIAYTQDLQAKLKDTVFMKGGCSSWYFTKDGWNSTVLP
jgi:cation diffusion facilitator CzcD-associated flavoprotein CzcO